MEWNDLLIDGFGRVYETMKEVLEGLSQDDLNWQPRHDCNSIGWECWHATRGHDAQVADLMGEEQLWIKEKWYAKFGRIPDPKDTGFGHTTEQVTAFKSPPVNILLEYEHSVSERSKRYFLCLSKTDLDRQLNEPWYQPPPTVGVRLVSIMTDSIIHAGQAAYIRGLQQGKGWLA